MYSKYMCIKRRFTFHHWLKRKIRYEKNFPNQKRKAKLVFVMKHMHIVLYEKYNNRKLCVVGEVGMNLENMFQKIFFFGND